MAACVERERRIGRHPLAVAAQLTIDAVHAALLVRRDRRRHRIQIRQAHPGESFMKSILYDVHDGLRVLRRAPIFSLVVVGTLALAIGANSAMFSVVNSVLLRTLPYGEPDRLVMLDQSVPNFNRPFGFSAPDFAAFRERAQSFDAIAAYRSVEYELSGVDQPERIQAVRVSAAFCNVLGVNPALGRPFTEDEDAGRKPVAIISDGLWRRKFGTAPGVVGQPIILDRRALTIVGVMPRGFVFPERGPVINNIPADVYVPISFTDIELAAFGSMYNNSVVARLRSGVSIAQAGQDARAVGKRAGAEIYPAELRWLGTSLTIETHPLLNQIVGNVSRMLYVLLAAVSVVLLIAAADIAGLMLTRAASRERELAVRAALGAGRLRLMRMMLVETTMLAAIGGAAGLLLAWWGSRTLVLASPIDLPRGPEVSLDGRVLLFTLGITLVAAFVCGLIPAWESSRRDGSPALKEGGRSGTASVRQRRIFGALVTVQFAMSIVLLASGGLLIRSFGRLLAINPGFRTEGVISLATSLPATTYVQGSDVRAFYGRLLERVRSLPGVTAAGAGTALPLAIRERRAFTIETPPVASANVPTSLAHDWVSGRYFDALGITILAGRALGDQDTVTSEPVIVVNQTMAARFWPGESPVGRRIAWGMPRNHGRWMRIVGVAADVKLAGLSAPIESQTWSPWEQVADNQLAENIIGIFRGMKLIVRSAVPPASLIPVIRQEVRALDPALPVTDVKTLEDVVSESTGPQRFSAALLGGFAGVALLLAGLGVAGVLAISVSRRTQEIGIRLALGARGGDVLRMVLRQGLTLAVIGLGIGLPCAFVATRVLASLLFDVGTHDPVAFGGATVLLLVVALVACAAPAIRASRVDPMTALRID
jgi:putative ABC transport system permease protein